MRLIGMLIGITFLASACSGGSDHDLNETYLAELEAYRNGIKTDKREEYLKLAGRFTIPLNDSISFGSARENDIVMKFAEFPLTAGIIFINNDSVFFDVPESLMIEHENGEALESGNLPVDEYGRTELFSSGRYKWRIMSREGNYFIRIRDEKNPAVEAFQGYVWFPPNSQFILPGSFTYYTTPKINEVPSVFDFAESEKFIGQIVFEFDGEKHSLDVGEDGFLMFSDQTTAKNTYGAGRYLWLNLPGKDGELTIDFNYAYNPPCIFSKFTTCKFAPAQNKMPFAIIAGETAESRSN